MSEVRLIDANKLKEELKQYFTDGVLDGVSAKLAFNQILHDIDNAPTVETDIEVVAKDAYKQGYTDGWKERFGEPEERTQGEWIKDNSGNRFCSECGNSALYHEIGLIIESRFCPNCGADMRKPNCVRCDHFGDCEGCERSGEE